MKFEIYNYKKSKQRELLCFEFNTISTSGELFNFYTNQRIQKVEPKKIPLITECVVCYENNKETLETGYFNCSHNNCCLECYNKLSIKICPICREKNIVN